MSPEAARDRLVWITLALARETPWGQSPDWDALKSAVRDLHDASTAGMHEFAPRERIARAMWAEWWEYPTAWENGSEPERAKFLAMADAAHLVELHAVRGAPALAEVLDGVISELVAIEPALDAFAHEVVAAQVRVLAEVRDAYVATSPTDPPKYERVRRDWLDDFAHENGCYLNTCYGCGKQFIGHKRRVACRLCASGSVCRPVVVITEYTPRRIVYRPECFACGWLGREHDAYHWARGEAEAHSEAVAGVFSRAETP